MKKKRTLLTTVYLFFLCFFTFSVTSSVQSTSISSDSSQTASSTEGQFTLSETEEEAATQLLDNPVVTFLLEHLRINKPTVFAIGITVIGLIFLLMSLFLPSLAKQVQIRQKNGHPTPPLRKGTRPKKFSGKGVIAIIGLILVLIGVVVQTVNQMN